MTNGAMPRSSDFTKLAVTSFAKTMYMFSTIKLQFFICFEKTLNKTKIQQQVVGKGKVMTIYIVYSNRIQHEV